VLEVADILRAAGPELCARLAVLPSQKRALQAIQQCRTAALGGQVYGCTDCGKLQYSYHSCGNRHCPKCHGQRTERWLQQQRGRLLPCPYFLLTFTLTLDLRALARSHQKLL
jgi:transposase-like zinc-binding protein